MIRVLLTGRGEVDAAAGTPADAPAPEGMTLEASGTIQGIDIEVWQATPPEVEEEALTERIAAAAVTESHAWAETCGAHTGSVEYAAWVAAHDRLHELVDELARSLP